MTQGEMTALKIWAHEKLKNHMCDKEYPGPSIFDWIQGKDKEENNVSTESKDRDQQTEHRQHTT